VSNPMGYSLRRSTGGRAWWSPSPPWPTLLCARRPAWERASSAPLFADQNAANGRSRLIGTLSGRDAWLSGSAWPPWRGTLAQRTGAGPTGQQDLQLAEQLPQGQADATRFGERSRSRVTKPCATKTSVTWWCQPTQPRPSKRAAGLLGDRVDRHRKLAVGGLAPACPSTGAAPPPSSCRPWESRCRRPPTRSAAAPPVIISASRRRTGRQSHGKTATKWCSAW
jgi:hypothetical protein